MPEPYSFVFRAGGGALPLGAWCVQPPDLGPETRICVVMHGVLRNARAYLEEWAGWAAETDSVVLAPEFDQARWPGSRSYNLGNVLRGRGADATVLPRPEWAFAVLEQLVERVREELGLRDHRFDLFGHSAGAQFVHRFVLFCPQAPLRRAAAAGAGWYTLPDLDLAFPYGLRHPALDLVPEDLHRWLAQPLTLMRGVNDVERDEHLRKGPEADAQGSNRFERAGRMYARALAADPRTRWRLVDLPGIAHDFAQAGPAVRAAWRAEERRPWA